MPGIKDTATIDVIAQDPQPGVVVLVMREPRPWDGGERQLFELQEKINAYLSFALDGEMAAAYFIDHFPHSFFPILNEGDLAVSLCFAFLYISFAGGGPWSLDALLGSQPSPQSDVSRT